MTNSEELGGGDDGRGEACGYQQNTDNGLFVLLSRCTSLFAVAPAIQLQPYTALIRLGFEMEWLWQRVGA